MLHDDIKNFQRTGHTRATIEIAERPIIGSLRIIERTPISELSEERIIAITSSYTAPTYIGSGYDDNGYPVFTFAVK